MSIIIDKNGEIAIKFDNPFLYVAFMQQLYKRKN